MPSPAYNDGTVQYGSRVWGVVKSDGTTARDSYVADNISVHRPTKPIRRTNQIGEPSGSVGVNDFVTGQAQLQLATGSTLRPLPGDQIICDAAAHGGFTNAKLDAQTDVGAETFIIESASDALTKEGEEKVNITFVKKYN